jgi:hypothetical protein
MTLKEMETIFFFLWNLFQKFLKAKTRFTTCLTKLGATICLLLKRSTATSYEAFSKKRKVFSEIPIFWP